MEKIGLAETIEALRTELAYAAASAAVKGLRFRVDQVSVELEVVTERVTTGQGGLKFWVVEVGADRSVANSHTHRVAITLTPLTEAGALLTADTELPR